MSHVTFIHGILNKPSPEVLLRNWQDALAANLGLDLAAEGITSSMVYWADVLYPSYEVEAELESFEAADIGKVAAGVVLAASMPPDEERFLAKIAAKFEAVAGGLDRELPTIAAAEDKRLERVPLPWVIKRRVLEAYLRDVHHYLFNVEFSPRHGVSYRVQDEIRRRFLCGLLAATGRPRPHVVVSHSMGTVIAYDCLKRVPECAGVDGLMTIGSPLGLDEIQDQLQPGWTRQDGFPHERLGGRWVNVFDRLDPVAGFDASLANDYLFAAREVIEDINEQNYGTWRHDISKYLSGTQLRNALRGLLEL